ncbi:MAG: hypothetical protein NZ516_03440, partial [Raineya sp.]|nr:hypothetical protein [Raineya sp.]
LSQCLTKFRSHYPTTAKSRVTNNADFHIKKYKTFYLLNAKKLFLFQKGIFFGLDSKNFSQFFRTQ